MIKREQNASKRWAVAVIAAMAAMASACGGGARPTLVAAPTPGLVVQAAPEGTPPLSPAPTSLDPADTRDAAVAVWAAAEGVMAIGPCATATPLGNELCHSPSGDDDLLLLGPASDEFWYVLTVVDVVSDDRQGFRVTDVVIAGAN